MNFPFEADWHMIKQRKQEQIKRNNKQDNAKWLPFKYEVGQSVLVSMDALDKFSTTPYKGPYEILKVNNNGTLRIQMGAVTDTVNIRRVYPYIKPSEE